MGRKLLADPGLPNKISSGQEHLIRPCIYCYVCVSQIFINKPMMCAVNSQLGNEFRNEKIIFSTARQKNILVVGAGPSGMEEARAPLHRAPPPACGCVAARPLRGRARSASSVAAAWDARPSPRPLLARYLRQETGEGQDSLHPSQLGGQGARGGAGGAFISRRAACATRVYEAVRRGRMRWLGAHLELLSCRLTAAHHA